MDFFHENQNGLSNEVISQAIKDSIKDIKLKKILIIPPDITRFHSKAGYITNQYYHLLKDTVEIDIMPALGTHLVMTKEECELMFGDIPYDVFLPHDWRNDVTEVGKVPKHFVKEVTDGYWNEEVTIEINKIILDQSYDLVLSIGQVVPHEVIGMANYSKNILVGCGGKKTINESHMIGAVFGMEKVMGKDHSPVRKVLDYGMTHFLKDVPLLFVLTVTTAVQDDVTTHGLFIGDTRKTFERAVSLAQKMNIDFLEKSIDKCVVYLDPKEFKSTWLGNKAIYRTRMAIKDGGELIILAPGVDRFGEDLKIDELIRKYGYVGRENILALFNKNKDLQDNMSAAAHLIHGSSEDRFHITYAVKHLSKNEIKDVNYDYASYEETIQLYNPFKLQYGLNEVNGESIFFIPNPALGLWISKEMF
jgi:nickel-dependent lactate racemase